jgi:hypothetical protein
LSTAKVIDSTYSIELSTLSEETGLLCGVREKGKGERLDLSKRGNRERGTGNGRMEFPMPHPSMHWV